jgi:hypothetical protein
MQHRNALSISFNSLSFIDKIVPKKDVEHNDI